MIMGSYVFFICIRIAVFKMMFRQSFSACFSDKSKRRTKTVKKSAEPKWNQTFIYSHVHRRDFRERMLEITVWDQPRVQEEESDFLGEVGQVTHLFSYTRHCYSAVQVPLVCGNVGLFN